ncbi:UTP--glucose-1-phosphate uridylyltransferase [Bacillus coahuilensis m2-6]|uniref:UTP--glucose-1-phosphate uridylyltransferase GalU n=1 Tax=Bacillus coahuilensis TaxID=408580 RepID=UPI0007506832|nr:UTP--glucose-1-phosphate uridylyltransferase GalU [Bacillus coahuilensis]KUP05419.1 UTP--glucose-1-phosphate uridylyltransferase [Bacillus coahuilensis m2-6]
MENCSQKKVKKAVIPAAGLGTRFLPATKAQPKEMLPILDKPTIQYIVEEAVASGIEDIIIVTGRGKRAIEDHFDKSFELEETLSSKGKWDELQLVQSISNLANIYYIRQKEPLGLGHAVLCAKTFIGEEPFAVLLGDDIMHSEEPYLKTLIEQYDAIQAPVIGVETVSEEDVSKYGIVEYKEGVEREPLLEVSRLIEKPLPTETNSRFGIMGRYILTSDIFTILETLPTGAKGEYQLTDAIDRLVGQRPVYAHHFKGKRYDIGHKFGFLQAQLEFALRDPALKDQAISLIQRVQTTLFK